MTQSMNDQETLKIAVKQAITELLTEQPNLLKDMLAKVVQEVLEQRENSYAPSANIGEASIREAPGHYTAGSTSDADFLLSMAGLFDSGIEDTSANVEAIVAESILEKHRSKA